nr:MAG TPA: hypothetical protein [Caudoviricetes sp.]
MDSRAAARLVRRAASSRRRPEIQNFQGKEPQLMEYIAVIYTLNVGENPPHTEASVAVHSIPGYVISDLKQAIDYEYDRIYKRLDLKNKMPVVHVYERLSCGITDYADACIILEIRKFLIEKYIEKTKDEQSYGCNNI